MKQDLLPPSYFDPKRTPKKGPGALTPVILPETKPSVPTAAVAIKVLHPRVVKLIQRDLTIMTFFARLVTLFPGMEWVSLAEEVEVFGRMMYEQLDLRKEADNLVTFERNFMSRKASVTFPRPLQIWSTTDLLIEEYQNAIPLELFLKNGGGPYDDQFAELGLDAFLVGDICCYRNVLIGRSEHVTLGQLCSLRPTSGKYYGQVFSIHDFTRAQNALVLLLYRRRGQLIQRSNESGVKCHRIGSQITFAFPYRLAGQAPVSLSRWLPSRTCLYRRRPCHDIKCKEPAKLSRTFSRCG
jgi:hypothetical protein